MVHSCIIAVRFRTRHEIENWYFFITFATLIPISMTPPRFFEVTDWVEKGFFNTKGTRNKCVVLSPYDNTDYYFKTSLNKPGRDYKYEFYSEIIASQIGQLLGFNTLQYDIAKRNNLVGCISKSMIPIGYELKEGINVLTGYDNKYKPEEKEQRALYSFEFIENALNGADYGKFIKNIVETIIFDAIIGNSDRHQENWGIISRMGDIEEEIPLSFWERVRKKKLTLPRAKTYFAQIYDSGCCLAREEVDDKVEKMLRDKIMFEAYINRGQSEIHWGNPPKKLNHFDLIDKVKTKYETFVNNAIEQVSTRFNEDEIRNIVYNIDNSLPEELKISDGLPDNRKELISRLIIRRVELLTSR